VALISGGVLIAAAFCTIAWQQAPPGSALFMAALAAATLAYL
jgi:hypothetical protein